MVEKHDWYVVEGNIYRYYFVCINQLNQLKDKSHDHRVLHIFDLRCCLWDKQLVDEAIKKF